MGREIGWKIASNFSMRRKKLQIFQGQTFLNALLEADIEKASRRIFP